MLMSAEAESAQSTPRPIAGGDNEHEAQDSV